MKKVIVVFVSLKNHIECNSCPLSEINNMSYTTFYTDIINQLISFVIKIIKCFYFYFTITIILQWQKHFPVPSQILKPNLIQNATECSKSNCKTGMAVKYVGLL